MTDEELQAMLAVPLPEELASRVHAIARAELPTPESGLKVPLRLAVSSAMVPALLVTAVAVRTAETVQVAETIYGKE